MKTFFAIICCMGCFLLGLYIAPSPEYSPPEVKILRTLSISNGILVDPNLYLGAYEVVKGGYILTIEDMEFIVGIRVKKTGRVLEFDEEIWTDILSKMYFITE